MILGSQYGASTEKWEPGFFIVRYRQPPAFLHPSSVNYSKATPHACRGGGVSSPDRNTAYMMIDCEDGIPRSAASTFSPYGAWRAHGRAAGGPERAIYGCH